jgi:hypothetical protein
MNAATTKLPEKVAAIEQCGYAVFADETLSKEFRAHFDTGRIPVTAIRHVRVWDVQVDDEREIIDHERTSVADEEIWEVSLRARDGSIYEVSAALLLPAPV